VLEQQKRGPLSDCDERVDLIFNLRNITEPMFVNPDLISVTVAAQTLHKMSKGRHFGMAVAARHAAVLE